MGSASSKPEISNNDYELAIKASKELEHILERDFGAEGKGLHERITSVEHKLSQPLIRQMRYVATIRNKLIHDFHFDQIPSRTQFITAFNSSKTQLQSLTDQRNGKGTESSCTIM